MGAWSASAIRRATPSAPMSQAMCLSSWSDGRPRSPRARGMRRLAWSTTMTKFDRPCLPSSMNGGGSSAASNRYPPPKLPAAPARRAAACGPPGPQPGGSVNLFIAAANLAFVQIIQPLDLGSFEGHVGRKQLGTQPLLSRCAGCQQGQCLAQAVRQRLRNVDFEVTPPANSVETGLHQHG